MFIISSLRPIFMLIICILIESELKCELKKTRLLNIALAPARFHNDNSQCYKTSIIDKEMFPRILSVFVGYFLFIYFIFICILLTHGKSNRGAKHRASNYPDLVLEMRKYCCPLETQ